MREPIFRTPSLWLSLSFLLCLVALTHNLTGYPLFDPDEGRNAEVAREMVARGDYVLPHLNGLPYLDKPILYFATGAMSMRALGSTVLASRLPSLLFTLATIVLVAWFASRLFGRGAAVTAAVATAATPFTLAYARIVIFDSALTFFVVLALASFYLAIEERPDDGEGWTALAWVAIAFGVLTKGPVALVLPLLVAIPFAIRYRAWRSIADPFALLLFGGIVAPWVIAVSLRIPDFLRYVLLTETLGRFSTSELGRTGPLWYFLAIFPAAALPWSLVLAGSARVLAEKRDGAANMDRRILFLLLWIAIPLLFFTFSQSKRPQYVLPLIPAVALMVAAAWQTRTSNMPGARTGALALIAIGAFLTAGSRTIPRMVPASPEIAAVIPGTAVVLGVACLVGGVTAWLARRRRDLLLAAFSLPVAAIPVSSHSLMREIGEERSAFDMAGAIEQALGSSARVIGVEAFPPSLPFYLRRTITVATSDGSELTSNYLTRHFREYVGAATTVRSTEWWREAFLVCSEPTAFVARTEDSEVREVLSGLPLIIATPKYVAYGPCGMETLASTIR